LQRLRGRLIVRKPNKARSDETAIEALALHEIGEKVGRLFAKAKKSPPPLAEASDDLLLPDFETRIDLPAISSARTETNFLRLDDAHAAAALGQMQRRAESRVPAAYDRDIGLDPIFDGTEPWRLRTRGGAPETLRGFHEYRNGAPCAVRVAASRRGAPD